MVGLGGRTGGRTPHELFDKVHRLEGGFGVRVLDIGVNDPDDLPSQVQGLVVFLDITQDAPGRTMATSGPNGPFQLDRHLWRRPSVVKTIFSRWVKFKFTLTLWDTKERQKGRKTPLRPLRTLISRKLFE